MPNPLLTLQYRIPFDKVKATDVEPAIDELLADAQASVDALASDSGPRTYANTMQVLDDFTNRLEYAMNIVRHLEGVATTPELRAAYNAVQPKVAAFYSSLPLNEGLWNVIKHYSLTDEAKSLVGARARFLKKTVDNFRRHGADLDADGKARLKELDIQLAQLTTKFSQNVLDATNDFDLVIKDEKQLAGLPPSATGAARQSAESKGYAGLAIHITPTELSRGDDLPGRRGDPATGLPAYNTRASSGKFDNREIMAEVLRLRKQKAELLGYRDFADLVLEDRMAHNGAAAEDFLEDLKEKTVPHFDRENRALAEFAERPLNAWDVGYYAEKQRKALYDFDEEALRPYFPLNQVVDGMFEIFGRVFGIRVKEQQGAPVWDPAVRYYVIEDEDGAQISAFYADWYPRENKRGGAWMDVLITGIPATDPKQPHLGLICGNLTPPIGDAPALLTHREVETIFHEFGHLLHHSLSRVDVRSLSGTNVPWDFVELPSQIMENWCWERESLDLFARHYQTGETIPEDLYQKMRRAKTFRAANAQMRQLGFGFVDLRLHREFDPARDGDVVRTRARFCSSSHRRRCLRITR